METNINSNIIDAVSKLIFYESSLKATSHPIDIDYIKENEILLQKVDIKDLIVHYYNNFPELFVHRFLLCILDKLILFDEKEWVELIINIKDETILKSVSSFFNTFLQLNFIPLSQDKTKVISGSTVLDEDDIVFITQNELQIKIDFLQQKLIKMVMFKKIEDDTHF